MTSTSSNHPYAQLRENSTWREEISDSFSDSKDDGRSETSAGQAVLLEEADSWAAGIDVDHLKTQALSRRQKKQRKRLETKLLNFKPDRRGRAMRRAVAAALPNTDGRRLAQWSSAGQRTKAFQTLTNLLSEFNFADTKTEMKREPVLPDDEEGQEYSTVAYNLRKETSAQVSCQTESTQPPDEHRTHFMALYSGQKQCAKDLEVSPKQYRQDEHPEKQLQAQLKATSNHTTADLRIEPQEFANAQSGRRSRILNEVQRRIAHVLEIPLEDYKLNGPHLENQETLGELCARLQGMQRQFRESKRQTRARNRKKLALERGFPENQFLLDRQVKDRSNRSTVRTKNRRARKRDAIAGLLKIDKKARKSTKQQSRKQQIVRGPEYIKEKEEENNDQNANMETILPGDDIQASLGVKIEFDMEL